MRTARYILRRFAFLPLQLIGISIVTFALIRLIPGDPARTIAGPTATPETIATIRTRLGLDESIPEQYVSYVENLFHGDWGTSIFTSQPVLDDLRARIPATLELISLALLLVILIGIPLGVYASTRRGPRRWAVGGYDLLSGAVPDFWLGLMLIYLFFAVLGWFPAPLGRLSPDTVSPETITGLYTVDSILTLNFAALWDALAHLALPVITLAFVYTAPVVKMTRSLMQEAQRSPHVAYARACGLPLPMIRRYALRTSLPPIVTLLGVTYAYLLGGAVLVEKVFSWAGVGQYAVDSIAQGDFAPVQGFVLIAATFSLAVYLVVDLVHFSLDPRVEH